MYHPEKDSIDTSGDTTYYYQRQYTIETLPEMR